MCHEIRHNDCEPMKYIVQYPAQNCTRTTQHTHNITSTLPRPSTQHTAQRTSQPIQLHTRIRANLRIWWLTIVIAKRVRPSPLARTNCKNRCPAVQIPSTAHTARCCTIHSTHNTAHKQLLKKVSWQCFIQYKNICSPKKRGSNSLKQTFSMFENNMRHHAHRICWG